MIQVSSGEQALIKTNTNRKPIQTHQSKTTYTLEFEFDRHLEHMVRHRMQSGLYVFVVGEFGAFEIFMQNGCFAKPDFSYFSNWKHKKQITHRSLMNPSAKFQLYK